MENWVEGWTGPIDYQLEKNGVPFNATGMSIELTIRDRSGAVVAETGPTTWLDATQSTARYVPAAGDLLKSRSPMHVRWKMTNGPEVVYFPKAQAEEWVIHLP